LKAEIDEFDRKTLRAQSAMCAAMSTNLKDLGVPFFGTNAALLKPEDYEADAKWTQGNKISTAQLRNLQKRMIEYLEDMYKV